MGRFFGFLLLAFFILTAVACQAAVVSRVDGLYQTDGNAMSPTFPAGSILGIDEQAYAGNLPQRGDIIVFKHPKSGRQLLKRIVGLPQETIEISPGELRINGVILNEIYLNEQARYTGRWELRENEYFVLGDNRNASSDSHTWGSLPFTNIIGQAKFVCSSNDVFSCTTEIESVVYFE